MLSLSYAEVMYFQLFWGADCVKKGTRVDFGDIKSFLDHLVYMSYKATTDLYVDAAYAEYDAEVEFFLSVCGPSWLP